MSGEPFRSEPGKLREAVLGAIEDVLGVYPDLNTGGGTSDGRFIAPTGAQVVELGPVNATIHKVDEEVSLPDLATLTEIYTGILRRLLSAQ